MASHLAEPFKKYTSHALRRGSTNAADEHKDIKIEHLIQRGTSVLRRCRTMCYDTVVPFATTPSYRVLRHCRTMCYDTVVPVVMACSYRFFPQVHGRWRADTRCSTT
jgi:hypothetical protein